MAEPLTPQAREGDEFSELESVYCQIYTDHDVLDVIAQARAIRATLEAENARLRAGIEDLRMFHADVWCSAHAGHRCNCGADLHNAAIDALLTAP